MTFRTRFLITVALVCHLLFAHALVTSQLLSSGVDPDAPQNSATIPSSVHYEDVTVSAVIQEKDGPLVKLHGNAEIHYSTYILRADEATYNSDSGETTADGHVRLDGGFDDEHVQASHATYNIRSETGRFQQVRGAVGMHLRGTRLMLTSSNPVVFTGKAVSKTGPGHYVVYNGSITTCKLPHPKWQFNARKVIVDVGGNAQIYHADFRVLGVPIFYFPYATHPIEKVRQSGFSMPDLGTSSTKGKVLGESIYWAINRSMDVEIGTQYFSARGWSPHGEFRARPSDSSFIDLTYTAVFDRGYGATRMNQGGENVRLDAQSMFSHGLRGVASIDYLSSYVYRLAFNEVFTQAVNSEVKSRAFLSSTSNGFFQNALAERYQNFESTTAGDVITITHAPSVEFSSVDRKLGRSPFYWSYDAEAGGLSRSEPSFSTATLVGRIDLNPTLSLPLVFNGWSLRPSSLCERRSTASN